ncbi:arylesterase [Shewanella gelidii]|uniref:arylesterase n=1 Tax=Shewanella gelidii TaxID=1642821 RepID=UPI00166A2AA3|nr:arylesterase [Shewanella gelidii]MCL1098281.1 arylesterase [Shewanella gelidii]
MALLLDIKSCFYSKIHRQLCRFILLACTLLCASFSVSASTVLILGDSLSASYGVEQSEGWVNLLQNKIPQHTIINGSVSGETTAGGLRRLPALLERTQPDLVFIELGGNDGLRGFPPQQLKNNLTKMIQLSKQSGAKVLLSQVMVPPNYGPRYSKLFSDAFISVSQSENITLAPFFMEQVAVDPSLMQRDGIHPNTEAQPIITAFMLPWITQELTNN